MMESVITMKSKDEEQKTERLLKLWQQLTPEQKDVTLLIIERIQEQQNETDDNGDNKF
jgi:hypothetical protein